MIRHENDDRRNPRLVPWLCGDCLHEFGALPDRPRDAGGHGGRGSRKCPACGSKNIGQQSSLEIR